MCDYSLHGVKNRLAVEGEQLLVRTFRTGSKGLVSMQDLRELQGRPRNPLGSGLWARFKQWVDRNTELPGAIAENSLPAVCIPPGAQLQLQGVPAYLQKELGVSAREEVTFTQLSADPGRYRDAVRFSNGQQVLLQRLTQDIQVKVVCLTLAEEDEWEVQSPRFSSALAGVA